MDRVVVSIFPRRLIGVASSIEETAERIAAEGFREKLTCFDHFARVRTAEISIQRSLSGSGNVGPINREARAVRERSFFGEPHARGEQSPVITAIPR